MAEIPDERSPKEARHARLASAQVYCESCRRETPHRILRVAATSSDGRVIRGVARCRECRLTHGFESVEEARAEVPLVLSTAGRSTRTVVTLPEHRRLLVGSGLPSAGPDVRLRRIDLKDGTQASEARAGDVATLWATRDPPPWVRVSVVKGRITRTTRLPYTPGTRFEVGASLLLDRSSYWVAAVRARRRTWRRLGDAFPAEEVERVYVRRTERPPAGRSAWRSERGTPSDSESARSTPARSRSSPGRRRARTSPRARTAASGATVQRSRPS
jgi:uncharacterized Zn finger protein